MNNPALSIVFPVYNKEKYMSQALDSLLAQTCTNSEIIIINDGSVDRSLEIAKEYAEKCDRINIIDQKNGGASAARNRGIAAAKGDYVIMLDADDNIEPDMHRVMVETAMKHNADIVVCNYNAVVGGASQPQKYDYPYNTLLDREYIEKEIIPNSVYKRKAEKFIDAHWAMMIKRSLLMDNNIRYNEQHRKEEDKPFIMQCLKFAQSMVFVEECFYNYIKHKDSLIHTYSERFDNIMRNFALYKELFSDIVDFDCDSWYSYFIRIFEECISFVLVHKKDVGNTKSKIMSIISHPESRNAFMNISKGYENIKAMYASDNLSGIYKYYMKKFRSLRIKIFVRNMLKK